MSAPAKGLRYWSRRLFPPGCFLEHESGRPEHTVGETRTHRLERQRRHLCFAFFYPGKKKIKIIIVYNILLRIDVLNRDSFFQAEVWLCLCKNLPVCACVRPALLATSAASLASSRETRTQTGSGQRKTKRGAFLFTS